MRLSGNLLESSNEYGELSNSVIQADTVKDVGIHPLIITVYNNDYN